MAGVTGRESMAAWARSSTWGTPASVTRQILLMDTNGLDFVPELVDDESFNQTYLGTAELGDVTAVSPELQMQMRFEHTDAWMAFACGSAATPVVVSSQAVNSLVAYTHTVTLADELTHYLTLAVNIGNPTQLMVEVPTTKIRGFSFRVGENGRMMVSFQTIGAKAAQTSAINTSSTVYGATTANVGNRVFRKNMRVRMNMQSAGALSASDNLDSLVRELTFGYNRPLADGDHVFNSDTIIEPDDNGFAEFTLEMTYARMNTVSANSLATALAANNLFKAEIYATGPYVNSTTQRDIKFEMPALQLYSFKANVVDHQQVRPVATFRMKQAASSPSGMAFVAPFKLTITNANSANLITG